ncbi:MAG: hypothetical protein H6979_08390 [Chromatiales bacterium]|nr:hypothetical protein [Chromatiales bacterium]
MRSHTPRLFRLPILLCIFMAGCNSQIPTLREWADQGIGQPITNLEAIDAQPESYASRIGWQTKRYELPNGNWVYVHPDRKDCEVHYEVDKAGIAVAYELVGKGCRYQ